MSYIIVSGSRSITDYDYLKECLDLVISSKLANIDPEKVVIVSGGARGVDQLAEKYAKEKGYKTKIFKAKWDKHKKSAGFKRNMDMARVGDVLVSLWDGKSPGTKHMMKVADKREIRSIIFLK